MPPHLEGFLRSWLQEFFNPTLERRVALRMGVRYGAGSELGAALNAMAGLSGSLVDNLLHPGQLPDAVDFALALDPALTELAGHMGKDTEHFARLAASSRSMLVERLEQLLDDGGSTLWTTVLDGRFRLAPRVDPTMQAAVDHAVEADDVAVAGLLARAWSKVYARQTDPDSGYLDALKEVERLACPLVLPRNRRASLNDVAKHLASPGGAAKRELVLTKLGDGMVEPIAAMFDRLWHGNLRSRHGSLDYREVTLDEARAGVQLAVLLVQWLTDGVLRPRDHLDEL